MASWPLNESPAAVRPQLGSSALHTAFAWENECACLLLPKQSAGRGGRSAGRSTNQRHLRSACLSCLYPSARQEKRREEGCHRSSNGPNREDHVHIHCRTRVFFIAVQRETIATVRKLLDHGKGGRRQGSAAPKHSLA